MNHSFVPMIGRGIDAGWIVGLGSCFLTSTLRRGPVHPLRGTRQIANAALETLSSDFTVLYSRLGHPSIAPERLLRAMLLQGPSTRSARSANRWSGWSTTCCSASSSGSAWTMRGGTTRASPSMSSGRRSRTRGNRDRLLEGDIAARFLAAALAQPRVKRLLSSEHFSLDGTLIGAWASLKSFKPKNPETVRRTVTTVPVTAVPAAAMRRSTSRAGSAQTKRMPAPTTPATCSIARASGWRPGCASSATA